MKYQFRPIAAWPGAFTKPRRNSPFQSDYRATLELLEGELSKISARNVAIQLALDAADIRNDGLPRTGARPQHPGVVLSFEVRAGAVSMPCDTFLDWKSNLRAIALTLEALRKINRYGVTKNDEQYRGWTALPPAPGDILTPDQAAAFVAAHAGNGSNATTILKSRDGALQAYRSAARVLHPDANAGEGTADFQKLQTAWGILKKYQEAA